MSDDSLFLFSLFESERVYIKNTLDLVHTSDNIIIEIGCFRGVTSAFLGQYCKDNGGKLICIDPWSGVQDNSGETEYRLFSENTKNLPVMTFRDRSENVSIFNRNISLIFVDGDHSLYGCYNDIIKYYPLLKNGGVMLVHDYFEPYWEKNIKGAVDKFISEYNIDTQNVLYPQFIEDDEQSVIEHRRDKNSGGFAVIFKR